jgi:hypothetical protein
LATRYYYFLSPLLSTASIVKQLAIGAPFAVVAPTYTQSPFTVVSIDDVGNNDADLLAAMSGFGYTFVTSTLVAPAAFGTVRHFGQLAAVPTVPAPASGDTFFDTVLRVSRTFDGTAWLSVTPPADDFSVLLPEGGTTGNATRIGQTVFDGCSFIVTRRMTCNRLLVRFTAFTAPGTARVLLFQAPFGKSGDGTTGPAVRIGTVATFSPGAAGNAILTFAEGLITIEPGILFILFGRDSAAGSVTFRTRVTQANDLLTANVDLQTHPTTFTTAIAATTSPATFDPRQSPTGAATGSASDLTVVARLYRV